MSYAGQCPDDHDQTDDAPWGWPMLLGGMLLLLPVVLALGFLLWWLAGWWPWL